MLCIASAVKKAWCDVAITLGKSSSRASVSSSMIESAPVFVEVVAFLLVDVQPRRADLLAFERFDQCFRVWISCPRPVLTIITPRFMRAIEVSLTRCFVSLVSGQWSVMMSERR